MLQQVAIANFRALRSIEVPLRPLTVLIGPNDSGKSAFLAALQYLVNGIGFQPSDHWRHDTQAVISLEGTTPQGTGKMSSSGGMTNGEVLTALRPVGFFHLLSQGDPMEAPGWREDQGVPWIGSNGEGVPALLDYLLRLDRKRFFAILDALRALVPGLEDMEVVTPHPANRRLDLVIEKGLHLRANLSSSGVRLLLVFVALAYHPSPPRIILLEEPETGLHPKRLGDVMRLLREITEGRHGDHAAQVIVTTHSPYLLDLVDLEKDQVLVFGRKDDGSRTAETADRQRLEAFLGEFLLGEVWYNQGEEGLVARRR
jgi:predicted ATPase